MTLSRRCYVERAAAQGMWWGGRKESKTGTLWVVTEEESEKEVEPQEEEMEFQIVRGADRNSDVGCPVL